MQLFLVNIDPRFRAISKVNDSLHLDPNESQINSSGMP